MDAQGGVRGEGRQRRPRSSYFPLQRLSAKLREEMIPVTFIEGIVCPQGEAIVFLCGGDDELEVLRDVFLVGLKNSAAFPRVVAPRGEKFSGNLAVVVPNDFPNECKLAFCDLVLKGGDTVKKEPNCFVRDVFIFH